MFERTDLADSHAISAALAVKKFARTVDNARPEDVRTVGALQRSMDHLCNLLDAPNFTFAQVT